MSPQLGYLGHEVGLILLQLGELEVLLGEGSLKLLEGDLPVVAERNREDIKRMIGNETSRL